MFDRGQPAYAGDSANALSTIAHDSYVVFAGSRVFQTAGTARPQAPTLRHDSCPSELHQTPRLTSHASLH